MTLTLINHDRYFAVEQAVLNYFPRRDGGSAVSKLSANGMLASATITYNGRTAHGRAWAGAGQPPDNALRLAFYRAAKQLVPVPPWGALTGVRPVKKANILLDQMSGSSSVRRQAGRPLSKERLSRELQRRFDVSPVRAGMAADCAAQTAALRDSLSPRDIALYIGIPFCPTRCAYCSFVSSSVERDRKLVEPYLDVLSEEIMLAGESVSRLGLRVCAVYWGGGTPAVLTPEQMSRVLRGLGDSFEFDCLREHTVELGRPDAFTPEKLAVLREHGVSRVSVNPQTLDRGVLEAIGRRHTPEQFFAAYEQTRSAGFDRVNVDLIAGLPEETPQTFQSGLKRVLSLAPENITIHTLAKKRGSALSAGGGIPDAAAVPAAPSAGAMLDGAIERLRENGYAPYYLYRQKFTEGGFENTGWSKPGHECLYNLMMMEELCTVFSLGAGGVTKIVSRMADGSVRLERQFHCKYPLEYIERRDTMKDMFHKLESLCPSLEGNVTK